MYSTTYIDILWKNTDGGAPNLEANEPVLGVRGVSVV